MRHRDLLIFGSFYVLLSLPANVYASMLTTHDDPLPIKTAKKTFAQEMTNWQQLRREEGHGDAYLS
jgi:hypothetical protein